MTSDDLIKSGRIQLHQCLRVQSLKVMSCEATLKRLRKNKRFTRHRKVANIMPADQAMDGGINICIGCEGVR